MDLQEKILYHQIHPIKLFTDISTAIFSLYLLWRHRIGAALLVMFIPVYIAQRLAGAEAGTAAGRRATLRSETEPGL